MSEQKELEQLDDAIASAILAAPKAELHVHIEGTLEPDLMVKLAKRNGIELKGKNSTRNLNFPKISPSIIFLLDSEDEIRKKRSNFKDLQDFLDLYYAACDVLKKEEDFKDLMIDYLEKAHADGVSSSQNANRSSRTKKFFLFVFTGSSCRNFF